MATRLKENASEHDAAVMAAMSDYEKEGFEVYSNPDGEKNREWGGKYIDVIALTKEDNTKAYVTEVETEDSVSKSEAEGQWVIYDDIYSNWYLAVPVKSVDMAKQLCKEHKIEHCKVITWKKNDNGTHTFSQLPGI